MLINYKFVETIIKLGVGLKRLSTNCNFIKIKYYILVVLTHKFPLVMFTIKHRFNYIWVYLLPGKEITGPNKEYYFHDLFFL